MDLPGHWWRLRYTVDTSKKRKIVEIGLTPAQDYPAGVHNTMTFSCEAGLDLSEMPADMLARDGLLTADLVGPAGNEVFGVNMVVKIYAGADGAWKRFIFNPLE